MSRHLSWRSLLGLGVLLLLILPLMIVPLGLILVQAFLVDGKLSLGNVTLVIGSLGYWGSLANTVMVSLGATAVATVLGVPLAWLFARSDLAGRVWLERLAELPMFIPPFVGAVAWTLLGAPRIGIANLMLRKLGVPEFIDVYTMRGMIWVMGLYLAPYVIMIVASALRSLDPSLEEAGQISGLTRLGTARRITLALVRPAILSSAVLCFSIAIGLFGTPVVLGWTRQILVVTARIWMASQAVPPDFGVMAVLAIYLMMLSALSLWLQQWLLRGRSYTTVTGKGFRARRLTLGRLGAPALALVIVYLLLSVVAPIAVLAAAALSTYTWSGVFSLKTAQEILDSDDTWYTLRNSVWISVVAATLASMLGLAVAWLRQRSKIRGRGLIEALVLLPVSVPGIAFGVGVMLVWIKLPLPVYGTALILIFALVGRFSAYSVRAVSANLMQVHPELEEAGRIAGLGRIATFRRITLPLVMPGIIAGWVLLFSFFITELSMVILLYTTESRTFSVLSFETWNTGFFSELAALSLIQLAIGMSVALGARVLMQSGFSAQTSST